MHDSYVTRSFFISRELLIFQNSRKFLQILVILVTTFGMTLKNFLGEFHGCQNRWKILKKFKRIWKYLRIHLA